MDRDRIRHIAAPFLGGLFLATLLGFIPAKLMRLNAEWGFPQLTRPVFRLLGILLVLAGAATFVYCGQLFKKLGKGTPVPTDPPTELVEAGLYRYSRNPIYVGYVAFALGEFFLFGQIILFLYAIVVFFGAHIAVVLLEEPPLHKKFGDAYLQYTKRVPRWFGKPAQIPPAKSASATEAK